MKTMKLKRIAAMLLCILHLFGCMPYAHDHGEAHAHTHAYAEEGCAHANVYEEYTGGFSHASGAAFIDDQNGKTHSIMGYRYMKYTCPDCSEVWYAYEDTAKEITLNHQYEDDNICYNCGYVNTCEHQDGDPDSWWYYELAEGAQWTANDDGKTHSGLAYIVYESYCDLCNVYFIMSRDETPQVYSDDHDYNDEGICYGCKYENTCEHPDEYLDSWWYYDLAEGAQWTANDDGKTHSALAYEVQRGRCDLCKMYFDISRDETPQVYTEEHYYENDVCQECGAENTCEHPEDYISDWYGYELVEGHNWMANDDGLTHTAYAYKSTGTYCVLCSMTLTEQRDETPQLYTESHYFYDTNICDECGYENTCVHPEQNMEYWMDYELLPGEFWTINDDGTHTGNCYEYSVAFCNLCKKSTLTLTGDAQVRTLPHEYYKNVCNYCGAVNACTHPNATTFTWVDYHTDPVADNGLSHTGIGTLYEEGWCADCQNNISQTILDENYSLTEQHYMTNGVCDVCGYETICDHSETDVFGSYRNGRDYAQKDARNHTGVYDYYETTYCTLCETNLSTELVAANTTYDVEHVFRSSGNCIHCGYVNTCTHEGEKEYYTYYDNYSTSLTVTQTTHSYTANEYEEAFCITCGIYLGATTTENVTVTENHKLNSKGVCIICGYGSDDVCTHENKTQTGGNQKNQTVVINDNGTHTRTFDVYWEYTCDDCGEEFETFMERGSETEAHVAGGNPTVCIICGSEMCERHYYRNGVCIECGYENECAHINAVFAKKGRNIVTGFADLLNGMHMRNFDVYHFYDCPDCGEAYAIFVEQGWEEEPHEYLNGVNCQCGKLKPCDAHNWVDSICTQCGEFCTHPQDSQLYYTYYELADGEEWIADENGLTHTAYAVKVIRRFCDVCSLEVEDSRDETAQLYSVDHSFLSDGFCYYCGYECLHENMTQTGGYQENKTCADLGDGRHMRAFDVYWIYKCPDCNMTSEEYIERGYEIEGHVYFGDGVHCDICGADQSCSHVRSGSALDYEMIFDAPQPHNEEFHLQTYTTYSRYLCGNCSGYFFRTSAMEGLEGHQFGEDGLCACGEQGEPMTCQHEHTEFRYCEENVVYSDKTDLQHTKTYDLYFYTWCLNCETRRVYQLEAPNQTTTENHIYEDGVCACGLSYLDGMSKVIILPDGLQSIEAEAFIQTTVDAYVVPEGCTEIGSRAFAQCASLKRIILPASVTTIAADAFEGSDGVIIIAPEGSAAQDLAEKMGYSWNVML